MIDLLNSQKKISLELWPPVGIKWYYTDDAVAIAHADCRDILSLIPDKSIDLVLTDPPYKLEFNYVWDMLGKLSAKVLKDGCSLFTLTGQNNLPYVLQTLTQYLEYQWCLMIPHRMQLHMFKQRLQVCWKPMLWFSCGKPIDHETFCDNLAIRGKNLWGATKLHEWGQSEEMAISPILVFTKTGNLILDPFLGSGTTAYCAKKLGRKCIGVEIEERYCEIAARRLSQCVMSLDVEPKKNCIITPTMV